jgi:hypothetical protein
LDPPQINNYQHNNNQVALDTKLNEVNDALKRISTINTKVSFDPIQIVDVFHRISEIRKNDRNDIFMAEMFKNDDFSKCLSMLRRSAPKMFGNDLVVCLKGLVSLNISSKNRLVQQILHHIKDDINELSLSQLAFLHFLLIRMKPNSLVEAIKIATPVVFDFNVSLKLNHENTAELTHLLRLITGSGMQVSNKTVTTILSALTLHGTQLTPEQVYSILWSMKVLKKNIPDEKLLEVIGKLVTNCIMVLNDNFERLPYTQMLDTLIRLVWEYKMTDIDAFYNEEFYEKCIKTAIEQEDSFDYAYTVMRHLTVINYVNYDLLNYIDQKIIENHTLLSTMNIYKLMTIISAFSIANYKSKNFDILKSIMHENPVFCNFNETNIPVLKFVCELLSLDFVSRILFDKILDEKQLYKNIKYNQRRSGENFKHLLLINQTLTLLYPEYEGVLPNEVFVNMAIDSIPNNSNQVIIKMLEAIYGEKTVQVNVLTNCGHNLDYVLSFDNDSKAIVMPCAVKFYENLPKSQVKSIALKFYSSDQCPINYPLKIKGVASLRKRTLQALNINEVDIPFESFNSLPDSEKLAFVEREIKHNLK